MKRVSSIKQVINIAKNSPDGFTIGDVKASVKGVAPNSLYSMLWKLKKSGFLTHNKETGKYVLGDVTAIKLTPVNKTKKPQSPSTALPPKGSHEREIRELTYQVRQLKDYAVQKERQLDDALAIIRYLEDKMFKAIQHDARNGSDS